MTLPRKPRAADLLASFELDPDFDTIRPYLTGDVDRTLAVLRYMRKIKLLSENGLLASTWPPPSCMTVRKVAGQMGLTVDEAARIIGELADLELVRPATRNRVLRWRATTDDCIPLHAPTAWIADARQLAREHPLSNYRGWPARTPYAKKAALRGEQRP